MIYKTAYLGYPFEGNRAIARIIFSNGTESQPLVTKRQALEVGESLLGIFLDEAEWLVVKEQIHASELIDKSQELEELVCRLSIQIEDFARSMERFLREMRNQDDKGEDWKS
jgi:hypothetical protein